MGLRNYTNISSILGRVNDYNCHCTSPKYPFQNKEYVLFNSCSTARGDYKLYLRMYALFSNITEDYVHILFQKMLVVDHYLLRL
ncbi:unnamed protein product [Blumeria hordei]|uniref:Uncharacterized protein n=1 Tax=Blumeria hordei TaxID=2867405 RepID=A0A383UUV8_BLUHO|nr:unnamed protein product [Blumeria hordei]